MRLQFHQIRTAVIGIWAALVVLALLSLSVFNAPLLGIVFLVLSIAFPLSLRSERVRMRVIGWLTGFAPDIVREAIEQTRIAEGGQPAQQPAEATMSPDEIDALLESERQEAILLQRHWPPSVPAPQNSWLGGLPALPDGVDWPHNRETGFALHHLCQIDLAEMPDRGDGQTLPRTGMMWFFADIDEEMCWEPEAGHGSSRVLYHPESTAGVTPRTAPATLPQVDHPLDSLEAQFMYRGPRPRVYPRWPVSGHVSPVWDLDEVPDGVSYSSGYYEAVEAAQLAARQKIVGEPVARDHTATGPFREVEEDLGEGRVKRTVVYTPDGPDGRFPYCGALARSMARALDDKVQAQITRGAQQAESARESGRKQGQDDIARQTRLDAAGPVIGDLVARLDGVAQDAPLDGDVQAAFDRVMSEQASARLFGVYPEQVLRAAVVEIVQGGFDRPDLLALLPQTLIKMVHDEVLPSHDCAFHYLMAPRNSGANPTPGEGVRLAQFDSDYALGMMFCDVGIIDFWIDAQDLAAGRWDRAWAATAGG